MAINNNKIRFIRDSMEYGPNPHGGKAGIPTVRLKLSKADSNAQEISSIDGLFDNWGWKNKLQSGYARLRLFGSEPLDEIHREGIRAFNDVVDPRFIDIEVSESDLDSKPSRYLQNVADSFTIFVPEEGEYDEDALQFFAERSRNYGDVEFVFKIRNNGDADRVAEFSREYKLYDSDIWLFPVGRQPENVYKNQEICVRKAKSNMWNVSPRMDVLENIVQEEE